MIEKSAVALSQDKQSKILNAANERFLHYGVSKTTMRDIAQDLGISVSNLYLYFENKREIVLAIAQSCREKQDLVVAQVLTDKRLKPAQKLERLLIEKFRAARNFRSAAPKSHELFAYLVQEFPERLTAWQDNLEDAIFAVLEEGTRSGRFAIKDVRHHAHMLRIATAQFYLPSYVELPAEPLEEELIALVRWFLSLIEIPGKSPL
jgi:AcrR family transcriptional regulator